MSRIGCSDPPPPMPIRIPPPPPAAPPAPPAATTTPLPLPPPPAPWLIVMLGAAPATALPVAPAIPLPTDTLEAASNTFCKLLSAFCISINFFGGGALATLSALNALTILFIESLSAVTLFGIATCGIFVTAVASFSIPSIIPRRFPRLAFGTVSTPPPPPPPTGPPPPPPPAPPAAAGATGSIPPRVLDTEAAAVTAGSMSDAPAAGATLASACPSLEYAFGV